MKKLCILALGIFMSLSLFGEDKGDILVKIKGIKNQKGFIMIALYDKKEDFLKDSSKVYKSFRLPIEDKEFVYKIEDVDFGEYAISYYHDENKSGKLEKNFIGIPKEGYGISNDARGKFGSPKYKDAKFIVDKEITELTMKTKY